MCIYNNHKGEDARVLKQFEEPSWNNPVLRIVGTDQKDVVARNGRGWNVQAVARQMSDALTARSRAVPGYLSALLAEEDGRRRGLEAAVFGMG